MGVRHKNLIFIPLLLLVWSCHFPGNIVSADYHRYEIDQDSLHTSIGNEISQIILPYKEQVDRQMKTVIGNLPEPLRKEKIESTLGNWMADAIAGFVQKETGRQVDLAICNYGGIRVPELAAGPLTVGDIYELMPFDNFVVTMEINGTTLKQLLNRIADYGGWPVSSSLRMEIMDKTIYNVMLQGEPLSLDRTYFVALSDYLANGGDQLDFLIAIPHDNLNVYYRDALIEMAKSQKNIVAGIEGRIKYLNQR